MTAPTIHLRRGVLTAAVAGGLAWVSGRMSLFAARGASVRALSGSDALADLCAGLSSSPAIGEACLHALPGINSKETLTRLILSDVAAIGNTFASTRTLPHDVRECSRDDFRSGRIIAVNGWIFSVTEARLYALAGLLTRA